MSLNSKVAALVEYLDLVDERKMAEEKLRQAVIREKAQAKIIYESEAYPHEVLLLVTVDRAIMIDFREEDFGEYKHPDSPVKIFPVQDAGAEMMAQLPESQFLNLEGF
jgi:hypothetical protein